MEKWDLYDINRQKLTRQAIRGEDFFPGEFHLLVHVVIFNTKGEMLIQQRQSFKEGWPNMWDVTCGGSAVAGDTSQQAASRELFEELGIAYNFDGIRPHFTNNFLRGFDDFYIVVKDIDLHTLILQPEEVQSVKWASKEIVLQMIAAGTFIPYFESLMSYLFDLQNEMSGTLRKKHG